MAGWRTSRDHWDDLGYGGILRTVDRDAIAAGRVPKFDASCIEHSPGDAGLLRGEFNASYRQYPSDCTATEDPSCRRAYARWLQRQSRWAGRGGPVYPAVDPTKPIERAIPASSIDSLE